jgi:hypothetical protein
MVLFTLLVASLVVSYIALRFHSWGLMALTAALTLPLGFVSFVPFAAVLLLPCLQLAMAVAMRWRLDDRGWTALLLGGALASFIGGVGGIVLGLLFEHRLPFVWVLIAGLLAGFAALVRDRPPWSVRPSP